MLQFSSLKLETSMHLGELYAGERIESKYLVTVCLSGFS